MIQNFNENKNRKDGLYPQCIYCRKDFYLKNFDKIKRYNEENREKRQTHLENKRESDVNFQLTINTRNRIYKSLKSMTKPSSAKDFFGTDIEAYRKWIEHHTTPEMNWTEIEIDHVKPICRFDLSKDEELKEAFG